MEGYIQIKLKQLIVIISILFLSACDSVQTSKSQVEITREPVTGTHNPAVDLQSKITWIADTTTPYLITETPMVIIPTKRPNYRQPIPQRLQDLFNKTRCSNYCWEGVMLGQLVDEIITALEVNNINYELKDYETATTVVWPIPAYTERNSASVKNDRVLELFVSTPDMAKVEFSDLLEIYGEPDLVGTRTADLSPEHHFFDVVYLDLGIHLRLDPQTATDGKQTVSPDNKLISIIYYLPESMPDYMGLEICYYFHLLEWRGFGGDGIYYDEYEQPLYKEERLATCP